MKTKFRESFVCSSGFAMIVVIVGMMFVIGLSLVVDLRATPAHRYLVGEAVSTHTDA